jgi:GTP-binding protein Era
MTQKSTAKKYPDRKPFVKKSKQTPDDRKKEAIKREAGREERGREEGGGKNGGYKGTSKQRAPCIKAAVQPRPSALSVRSVDTYAGFVAILGAPNAGKSTLLNRLVGEKISIVSPKTQTTRMRVVGVLTEGKIQTGFIDTPGIFAAARRLDHAMVKAAWSSLKGANVIILLVDASARMDERTEAIVDELRRREKRVIVALNKLDKIGPARMLPLAQRLNDSAIVDDVFMISALTGDGVKDLKKHVMQKMPPGPWLFAADYLSDTPSPIMAAEMTREQLYCQLQQELPYGATVIPKSWETKTDGSLLIRQSIVVARASHRPIVLGAGGARIKSISQAARQEMVKRMNQKIHLFLDVKIDEKWQEKSEFYRLLGLEFART